MKYTEPSIVIPELEDAPEDLHRRQWTAQEKDILWKYRNKDPQSLARYFGRSVNAVYCQISRMKDEGRA